jgi:hypothetical protein
MVHDETADAYISFRYALCHGKEIQVASSIHFSGGLYYSQEDCRQLRLTGILEATKPYWAGSSSTVLVVSIFSYSLILCWDALESGTAVVSPTQWRELSTPTGHRPGSSEASSGRRTLSTLAWHDWGNYSVGIWPTVSIMHCLGKYGSQCCLVYWSKLICPYSKLAYYWLIAEFNLWTGRLICQGASISNKQSIRCKMSKSKLLSAGSYIMIRGKVDLFEFKVQAPCSYEQFK